LFLWIVIFKKNTSNLIYYLLLGNKMPKNEKKKPIMSLKEKRKLKKESNKDNEVKPRKKKS
tara:strand:- start:117789 stop:117971 length:183 start_codon:yes stop_codon:yes gene_type:complete